MPKPVPRDAMVPAATIEPQHPSPPGAGAPGPLRLTEVTTLAGLRELARSWDTVLAASETSTPFLTHEWVLSWWETFGAGQDLFVLLIEDEQGVAGIAPLARARRRSGPVGYRAIEVIGTGPLRFLGMGLSDRSDLLLARRREECLLEVMHRLAAERREWDVLDLRFVPETSATVRTLAAGAGRAGLGIGSTRCSESPYLPLEGTYEDYVRGRTANFRSGLKRKLKKLEAAGSVELALDCAGRDPQELLAAARSVSLESWKAEEGSALLAHRKVYDFFSLLLPRLQASGRLYLSFLSIDGQPAAHELGFRFANRLWFYDHAYRTRHAALSPGYLLTAKIIEKAWADGLLEYDFLRGNENYKRGWVTQERRELQVVLDSGTARGRLARNVAYAGKWWLKRSPFLVQLQGRVAGLVNRVAGR